MKKKYIVLFVCIIGMSTSSCMMMMAGHNSNPMAESHNHDTSIAKIDRVCGKEVQEGSPYACEYMGKTYRFDTEQCLSVFNSNPDHFLQKNSNDVHHKTWTKVGWIGGAAAMTAMMIVMVISIL